MSRNKFTIIAIMVTLIMLSCVAGCGTNNPENVIRNYVSIVVDVFLTGTIEPRKLNELSNACMNQQQAEQNKRMINELINKTYDVRQEGAIFDATYDIESVSMQESNAIVVAVLHLYMKHRSDERNTDVRLSFTLSKNDKNEWKIMDEKSL